MTVEEADIVNKGDIIIYVTDNWDNNIIDIPVKVVNIYKENGIVTHFDVKPVDKKNKTYLESAFAPIYCFKFN